MIPAEATEDHGAERGPDAEPARGPNQRQAHPVGGPSKIDPVREGSYL